MAEALRLAAVEGGRRVGVQLVRSSHLRMAFLWLGKRLSVQPSPSAVIATWATVAFLDLGPQMVGWLPGWP